MPKREDEFWAGQKEGLRYCSRHKRYYKVEAGCQLCQFEKWGREQKKRAPLQKCPDCQRNSLCWDKKGKLYVCLNPECGHTFTESKLRARELEAPVEELSKEQIPEEKPQLQRCPICGEKALFWDESSELYECLNRKCRRRFTRSELDNIMRGVVTIDQVTTPPEDNGKSRTHRGKFKPRHKPPRRKRSLPSLTKVSWTALPVIVLLIAGLAIIFYAVSHKRDLNQIVFWIVILAAIITTIWSATKLSWLWKYRPRKARLGGIARSFIFLTLIGFTALAFTGVAPFSDVKESATKFFESTHLIVSITPSEPSSPVTEKEPDSGATIPNGSRSEGEKAVTEKEERINISELEVQIHDLVNAERSKHGLPALIRNDTLYRIAVNHSTDMATRGYFSHISPEGTDLMDRYEQGGFPIHHGGAENIFKCNLVKQKWYMYGAPIYSDYYTQEEIALLVVNGWMESPGHRGNILNPLFNCEGIGIAISSDGWAYITQNFG